MGIDKVGIDEVGITRPKCKENCRLFKAMMRCAAISNHKDVDGK